MLKELAHDEIFFLGPRAHVRRIKNNDRNGYLTEQGHFLNINHNSMKPVLINNFFSEDVFNKIIDYANNLPKKISSKNWMKSDMFGYFYLQRDAFFTTLHKQLTEKASTIFNEKVKPSYHQFTLYSNHGVCPLHVDRPQCKYTIDVLLDQEKPMKPWPLWIDDVSFNMKINDAVCYSGTDSIHCRERINQKYANLIFFHYVPENFEGSLD